MAYRMILQISVTDPGIDEKIRHLAEKMGGRSAGWTKGRVVCEAVRLFELHNQTIKPVNEPQEAENDII